MPPVAAIAVPSCKGRDGKSDTELAMQFISKRCLFKKELFLKDAYLRKNLIGINDTCTRHKWQGLISRVLQWGRVRGGH